MGSIPITVTPRSDRPHIRFHNGRWDWVPGHGTVGMISRFQIIEDRFAAMRFCSRRNRRVDI